MKQKLPLSRCWCTKAALAVQVQGWVYSCYRYFHLCPAMTMWSQLTMLPVFLYNMLDFFFQMAFWGLKSFVRWPFPCKGIHVFCCILESIREQCLEQDRVSSWTDTGLIMPFVTTDIPVLQATRWCGHWYAVTHSEDLFCINMLANCTKIKQLVSACRSF